jgi:hypothetical protein
MHALDTPKNIHDFVACVRYAMLFGAIESANTSAPRKLLMVR